MDDGRLEPEPEPEQPAVVDVDDATSATSAAAEPEAAASSSSGAGAYPSLPIKAPTAADLAVAEARKKVLRALDAKICEQDEATALAAIETALKLAGNVVDQPSEPKFRKFRANNPGISKKLLKCPGGVDLLLGLGFHTKVMEFEEFWVTNDADEAMLIRTLADGVQALERYRELTTIKLERNAKVRREKLANMNDERARTLQAIEEDKQLRRERAELAAGNR